MDFRKIEEIFCMIFLIICTVMEICSFSYGCKGANSVCVRAGEISDGVFAFLNLISVPMLPNVVLFFLHFPFPSLYQGPMVAAYHFLMFACTVASGTVIHMSLTYCGNEVQDTYFMCGMVAIASGIIHLLLSIRAHIRRDPDEMYYK